MSHDVPYWNNYNKTVRISRWHLSTPYTSSDPGFSIYFWNTEILKLGILIYVLANSIRHTFGVCSQEIKWHFQLFYRKHSSVDNRCYLVWFTRKKWFYTSVYYVFFFWFVKVVTTNECLLTNSVNLSLYCYKYNISMYTWLGETILVYIIYIEDLRIQQEFVLCHEVQVMCVCLCIVISYTYCVVFLLCLSSSCVPYVANVSGLSICDCPFGILKRLLTADFRLCNLYIYSYLM